MLANHEKILKRIASIPFDLSVEANQVLYAQYEEKMVIKEQLKGVMKDIETAKTMVLSVRLDSLSHA